MIVAATDVAAGELVWRETPVVYVRGVVDDPYGIAMFEHVVKTQPQLLRRCESSSSHWLDDFDVSDDHVTEATATAVERALCAARERGDLDEACAGNARKLLAVARRYATVVRSAVFGHVLGRALYRRASRQHEGGGLVVTARPLFSHNDGTLELYAWHDMCEGDAIMFAPAYDFSPYDLDTMVRSCNGVTRALLQLNLHFDSVDEAGTLLRWKHLRLLLRQRDDLQHMAAAYPVMCAHLMRDVIYALLQCRVHSKFPVAVELDAAGKFMGAALAHTPSAMTQEPILQSPLALELSQQSFALLCGGLLQMAVVARQDLRVFCALAMDSDNFQLLRELLERIVVGIKAHYPGVSHERAYDLMREELALYGVRQLYEQAMAAAEAAAKQHNAQQKGKEKKAVAKSKKQRPLHIPQLVDLATI